MEPGNYYHIFNRGVNRQRIFFEEENYRYFVRLMKSHLRSDFNILAFCLMPNHFHIFVRIKENSTPKTTKGKFSGAENAIRKCMIAYVKAINKRYNRDGPLFRGRYGRKHVDSNEYIVRLYQYIHLNPVESGLVSHPEAWSHSSYKSIVADSYTFVDREEAFHWFGDRSNFEAAHNPYAEFEGLERYLGI